MVTINKIRHIKKARIDLTDFLIHFTRYNQGLSSFGILKQIISDGYLKTGWSKRGKRRTIFGKRPAVCFTESPLFGFVNYVKERRDINSIDNYGIAFTREDLFKISARNVIYGTTDAPNEREEEDGTWTIEGFPYEEQYRYVLTTDVNGKNDWMHEREWRWTQSSILSKPPNELSVWCVDYDNYYFKVVVVIVKAESERSELIDLFRQIAVNFIMARLKDPIKYGFSYTLSNLINTCIVTLDDIDFSTNPYYTIEYAIEQNEVTWLKDKIEELKPAF